MLLPSIRVFLLLVFYSISHFHILIFATAQIEVITLFITGVLSV